MRKQRLREGDMEKYRPEMELELGHEHRTVRDKWQSESEMGDGTGVGAETCAQPGVGADRDRTDSRIQLRAQCPLSCDLGSVALRLSIKISPCKMKMVSPVTLSS